MSYLSLSAWRVVSRSFGTFRLTGMNRHRVGVVPLVAEDDADDDCIPVLGSMEPQYDRHFRSTMPTILPYGRISSSPSVL